MGSPAEGPVEALDLHCQVFPSSESIPDFPGVALWTGTPGHPAEGFPSKTLEMALYYADS